MDVIDRLPTKTAPGALPRLAVHVDDLDDDTATLLIDGNEVGLLKMVAMARTIAEAIYLTANGWKLPDEFELLLNGRRETVGTMRHIAAQIVNARRAA